MDHNEFTKLGRTRETGLPVLLSEKLGAQTIGNQLIEKSKAWVTKISVSALQMATGGF